MPGVYLEYIKAGRFVVPVELTFQTETIKAPGDIRGLVSTSKWIERHNWKEIKAMLKPAVEACLKYNDTPLENIPKSHHISYGREVSLGYLVVPNKVSTPFLHVLDAKKNCWTDDEDDEDELLGIRDPNQLQDHGPEFAEYIPTKTAIRVCVVRKSVVSIDDARRIRKELGVRSDDVRHYFSSTAAALANEPGPSSASIENSEPVDRETRPPAERNKSARSDRSSDSEVENVPRTFGDPDEIRDAARIYTLVLSRDADSGEDPDDDLSLPDIEPNPPKRKKGPRNRKKSTSQSPSKAKRLTHINTLAVSHEGQANFSEEDSGRRGKKTKKGKKERTIAIVEPMRTLPNGQMSFEHAIGAMGTEKRRKGRPTSSHGTDKVHTGGGRSKQTPAIDIIAPDDDRLTIANPPEPILPVMTPSTSTPSPTKDAEKEAETEKKKLKKRRKRRRVNIDDDPHKWERLTPSPLFDDDDDHSSNGHGYSVTSSEVESDSDVEMPVLTKMVDSDEERKERENAAREGTSLGSRKDQGELPKELNREGKVAEETPALSSQNETGSPDITQIKFNASVRKEAKVAASSPSKRSLTTALESTLSSSSKESTTATNVPSTSNSSRSNDYDASCSSNESRKSTTPASSASADSHPKRLTLESESELTNRFVQAFQMVRSNKKTKSRSSTPTIQKPISQVPTLAALKSFSPAPVAQKLVSQVPAAQKTISPADVVQTLNAQLFGVRKSTSQIVETSGSQKSTPPAIKSISHFSVVQTLNSQPSGVRKSTSQTMETPSSQKSTPPAPAAPKSISHFSVVQTLNSQLSAARKSTSQIVRTPDPAPALERPKPHVPVHVVQKLNSPVPTTQKSNSPVPRAQKSIPQLPAAEKSNSLQNPNSTVPALPAPVQALRKPISQITPPVMSPTVPTSDINSEETFREPQQAQTFKKKKKPNRIKKSSEGASGKPKPKEKPPMGDAQTQTDDLEIIAYIERDASSTPSIVSGSRIKLSRSCEASSEDELCDFVSQRSRTPGGLSDISQQLTISNSSVHHPALGSPNVDFYDDEGLFSFESPSIPQPLSERHFSALSRTTSEEALTSDVGDAGDTDADEVDNPDATATRQENEFEITATSTSPQPGCSHWTAPLSIRPASPPPPMLTSSTLMPPPISRPPRTPRKFFDPKSDRPPRLSLCSSPEPEPLDTSHDLEESEYESDSMVVGAEAANVHLSTERGKTFDMLTRPERLREGMSIIAQVSNQEMSIEEAERTLRVVGHVRSHSRASNPPSSTALVPVTTTATRTPQRKRDLSPDICDVVPDKRLRLAVASRRSRRETYDNSKNQLSKERRSDATAATSGNSQSVSLRQGPSDDDSSDMEMSSMSSGLKDYFGMARPATSYQPRGDEFDLSQRSMCLLEVVPQYDIKSRLYKIHSKAVKDTTIREIVEHFKAVRPELFGIFQGNITSVRHIMYVSGNNGKRELRNLSVSLPFTGEQASTIVTLIYDHMVPDKSMRYDYMDYVNFVLRPEAFIRIYSRINSISFQMAETELRFRACYDGDVPPEEFSLPAVD